MNHLAKQERRSVTTSAPHSIAVHWAPTLAPTRIGANLFVTIPSGVSRTTFRVTATQGPFYVYNYTTQTGPRTLSIVSSPCLRIRATTSPWKPMTTLLGRGHSEPFPDRWKSNHPAAETGFATAEKPTTALPVEPARQGDPLKLARATGGNSALQ